MFKSLGLIKKTLLDNKKPAFNWVGLSGLDEFFHANRNIQQNIEEKSENIEEKVNLN